MEKIEHVGEPWGVWGTSVAAFSLLGDFSIADEGIGIDLTLLVGKYLNIL